MKIKLFVLNLFLLTLLNNFECFALVPDSIITKPLVLSDTLNTNLSISGLVGIGNHQGIRIGGSIYYRGLRIGGGYGLGFIVAGFLFSPVSPEYVYTGFIEYPKLLSKNFGIGISYSYNFIGNPSYYKKGFLGIYLNRDKAISINDILTFQLGYDRLVYTYSEYIISEFDVKNSVHFDVKLTFNFWKGDL